MAFAYCPDCAGRIYLGRKPQLGQPAVCDYCDADLEVVGLNPPELEWTDNVTDDDLEEDWEFALEKA
jgi:lysine biosynthesis protein LysW